MGSCLLYHVRSFVVYKRETNTLSWSFISTVSLEQYLEQRTETTLRVTISTVPSTRWSKGLPTDLQIKYIYRVEATYYDHFGTRAFYNNNRLITLSGGYKNLHYLTQFIVTTSYMYKKNKIYLKNLCSVACCLFAFSSSWMNCSYS